MIRAIDIRPLATLEILDAYDWYESQQEGLGLKFLEALDPFMIAYSTILILIHITTNQ